MAESIEIINNKMKEVIISRLKELRCAIIQGNIASVKHIDKLLHGKECLDGTLFEEMCSELESQCLTKNDFIILATEHKQVEILYYLFYETNILYYITRRQTERELEDEERRQAFCLAMCSDNIDLLEVVYDHWCNMHRAKLHRGTDDDVIQDLQRLSRLLNEARDQCEDQLIQHQQMYVNVHCLIKFTTYLIDMYTKLRDLRLNFDYSDHSEEGEAKRERILVLNILRIYEKYSDINNIRLKKCIVDEDITLQALLDDDSSIYMKSLLIIMYEMYFRKLDFNVSLLLLNKLYILKQRLKIPEDTYQKLECALFYYIYHVSEDWRLYLPINREILITDITGVHNGTLTIMKAVTDTQQQLNAPVIYLERRHFQKSLCEFKTVLESISTSDDVRKKEEKITKTELICLRMLPLMRDDYSLKRIVQYIEPVLAIDKVNDKQTEMLIIERTIQVIGEMFKNNEGSFQLSKTTKALLQTAVGIETVNNLQKLGDKLSHAEKGELNDKIRMETTEVDLFKEVKTDVETIIHRINTVLKIYKPILDEAFIKKGLILLQQRLSELPIKATYHTKSIKDIFVAYNLYNHETYFELEASFMTETWSKLGFGIQLFREIGLLELNSEHLAITRNLIKERIRCAIVGTLPKYFELINNTLKYIKDNYARWRFIKREVKHLIFKDDLSAVHDADDVLYMERFTKDYNDQWESVKEVLRFIIEEMRVFDDNHCSVNFYCNIQNRVPNKTAIKHVVEFMKNLENRVGRLINMNTPDKTHESFEPYEFRGIGKMINMFDVYESEKNLKETHGHIKMKREHLFESLISRLDLLKKSLNHPTIPLNQLLVRYECDQKFRIVIEMLLVDIMSVFVACKIKSPQIKSYNLLTEINFPKLRDHGNPFLEVVGEALDSQDITAECITWAKTMADDSAAIEALYTLFNENVEFDTIKSNIYERITAEQQKKLGVFKSCERWPDYLNLIPNSR